MQDFWEFPGGKVMPGESSAAALQRELDEELGIQITVFDRFFELQHDYPDTQVAMQFFIVAEWQGIPYGREGQKLQWLDCASLGEGKLLAADEPLVEALRHR